MLKKNQIEFLYVIVKYEYVNNYKNRVKPMYYVTYPVLYPEFGLAKVTVKVDGKCSILVCKSTGVLRMPKFNTMMYCDPW